MLIAAQERVGFVNEQCRTEVLDDTEERGRADVGGGNGAVSEFAENGQEGSLAALLLGRFDADVRADVTQLESEGMNDPKSQRFSGPEWQNDEAPQRLGECIEEKSAVDGVGPGREGGS